MARNPDYYQQIRARGICVICRQPMPDTDPRLAHTVCSRRKDHGEREADIRESMARAAGLIAPTAEDAQRRLARAERLMES